MTKKQENKLFHAIYISITINILLLSFVYLPADQGESMAGICTFQCAAANLTDLIFCLTPWKITNEWLQIYDLSMLMIISKIVLSVKNHLVLFRQKKPPSKYHANRLNQRSTCMLINWVMWYESALLSVLNLIYEKTKSL